MPFAADHGRFGEQQDLGIQLERPLAGVLRVQRHLFLGVHGVSTAHLLQAGSPWLVTQDPQPANDLRGQLVQTYGVWGPSDSWEHASNGLPGGGLGRIFVADCPHKPSPIRFKRLLGCTLEG